ncbi:hypothetical protein C8R43DRAFT_873113, partial [Mycena crocata]
KRPPRIPGLTVSNAGHLVPEAVRKRFTDGWKMHVPLHLLTDDFCAFSNRATAKQLNDLFTMDGSSGTVVSVAKEISFEPELHLSFDKWFQAWGRLRELIATYFPEELEAWVKHYKSIPNRPNRADNWSLCLEYDSEIRRRSHYSSIDPAMFHLDVWNELEPKHMAQRAIDLSGGPSSRNDEHVSSGSRSNPYKRQNGDHSNHSFRGDKGRCFVCGDDDPNHKAKNCDASRLVNGKNVILMSQKGRKDRDGVAYCFRFNGRIGCSGGVDCASGKHWCSLCGAKNGLHSAQNCATL